ncbi:hypothetical protein [Halobacterium yunchengense]|uniref:hypothetical protein n=1 Tax=Halobacterium yunchengense TaxID=3108497 RepID=UPI0030094D1C
MTRTPPLSFDVADSVRVGGYAVGVVAAAAAAYHAGQTGDWRPLLAVAVALSLAVLLFDAG